MIRFIDLVNRLLWCSILSYSNFGIS